MDALRWMFSLRLPDTDDPHVRKRVVYTMMFMLLLAIFATTFAIDQSLASRRRLDDATAFERNICVSQNRGRLEAHNRNVVIRGWLVSHGAPDIAKQIIDSPQLDCRTGKEVRSDHRSTGRLHVDP